MEQSDPSVRAHAKLSASQAKRWMTCPGSVATIDSLPREYLPRQSSYAALGTAAHSLVEECVRNSLDSCRGYRGYWISPDGAIERSKRHPEAFEVDHDMMDAVDVMLRTVWGELARLGAQAKLRVEHRFDLSWLRPDMFGTNDVSVSLFMDELVVLDYKHGQGVPVEVAYPDPTTGALMGNAQLMYYALGAAKDYDFTHERITLIVVQPRCPHPQGGVRRHTIDMAELLEFRDRLAAAADVVHQATSEYMDIWAFGHATADEAMANGLQAWQDRYLSAGDHCRTAFCPRIAICPAVHARTQLEACADFDEPPTLEASLPVPQTPEGIARALKWVPLIDARNKALEQLGQRLLEQGIELPGFKLVRKRANRVWKQAPEAVAVRLREEGLTEADFMSQPKLLSPAQVEKVSKKAKELVNGKKLSNDEAWLIEPLAEKGHGSITMADEADPRPAEKFDPASDFPDGYTENPEEG